jgi:hypothetical protein
MPPALESPEVGGGECVAPWQVEAVQPVRGHVIVPPLLELDEPSDALAVACAVVPLMAWQVADVQPVCGHMYVCPATAVAEAADALVWVEPAAI